MFLNVYQNLGRRKLALLDQRDEMGHIDILGADVRTGFGSVAAVDTLITINPAQNIGKALDGAGLNLILLHPTLFVFRVIALNVQLQVESFTHG